MDIPSRCVSFLQVITSVQAFLALLMMGSLANFVFFHIYLMTEGLSTYEWQMRNYRRAQQARHRTSLALSPVRTIAGPSTADGDRTTTPHSTQSGDRWGDQAAPRT